MEAIVFYGILVLTFGMLFFQGYFLDKVSNNGIYYGVRVPDDQKDIDEIKVIKKEYKKRFVICILPLVIIAMALVYVTKRASVLLITILLVGFFEQVVYYFTWKKMKSLKKEKGWTAQARNVVIVDIRGKKEKKEKGPLPDKAFLYLGIFVVISIVFSFVMYDKIPDTFANHYDIAGNADGFVQRGTTGWYFSFAMNPIMQIVMIATFYYSNKYALVYKKLINSGSIKGVAEKQRIYRRYMSIYLFVLAFEIVVMSLFMQISIFYPELMKLVSPIAFAAIMISAFGGIIIFFVIGQGGRNIKVKDEGEMIYRDDDDLYFLGDYYYNKQDPCIMIQRRMGIGTDFNYGNRIAQVIAATTVIILIVVIIGLIMKEPKLPF